MPFVNLRHFNVHSQSHFVIHKFFVIFLDRIRFHYMSCSPSLRGIVEIAVCVSAYGGQAQRDAKLSANGMENAIWKIEKSSLAHFWNAILICFLIYTQCLTRKSHAKSTYGKTCSSWLHLKLEFSSWNKKSTMKWEKAWRIEQTSVVSVNQTWCLVTNLRNNNNCIVFAIRMRQQRRQRRRLLLLSTFVACTLHPVWFVAFRKSCCATMMLLLLLHEVFPSNFKISYSLTITVETMKTAGMAVHLCSINISDS